MKTYRCYATDQRVDPIATNATTKVELVPRDVTTEDVAKAFQLPPLDPLAKCF